jgi:glutaryl-CoA dehydrogenase
MTDRLFPVRGPELLTARELLGGNGILLEHHVGRFVADAEAIYSYEATREMNTLIVGWAITELSAFV